MTYVGIQRNDAPNCVATQNQPNGCGETAAASLVYYYKRVPYFHAADHDTINVVQRIYHDHPPDTPNAAFGCTPGHVENICKAVKLQAWRTYGPQGAKKVINDVHQRNQMVIVLLDLGKMGSAPIVSHHYGIAYAHDENNVYLTNMAPTQFGSNRYQSVPWNVFMDAWHCWMLPSADWQYAGIVGY
jgi:hypothetical protein